MNLLRIVLLVGILSLVAALPVSAEDNEDSGSDSSWNKHDSFLRPYKQDAYGPGVYSDATGRPFEWRTESGEKVQPGISVKPDAYGLGTGMDEYGRAVKPSRKW